MGSFLLLAIADHPPCAVFLERVIQTPGLSPGRFALLHIFPLLDHFVQLEICHPVDEIEIPFLFVHDQITHPINNPRPMQIKGDTNIRNQTKLKKSLITFTPIPSTSSECP
jgi:hypothetical protein